MEELEKQHEAKLRIARQRLQIEKQTQLRKLEIQQLEEEHRKQVAAAALEETKSMTKPSLNDSSTGKTSELFTERSSVKSKKFFQGWINSSPAGNMADAANEVSLQCSDSTAQSNSDSKINTHGQVGANINLPVHESQDPSSRSNVINHAHIANITASIYASITKKLCYANSIKPPLNTAQQLNQATMHFKGLQCNHQFPRRSIMRGQLNLVSPHRSPPVNALPNAPLALNSPQEHLNEPTLPSHSLNLVPPHFPLIPPAFRFAPSPPQAFPLHANNTVVNIVNPLPLSPPAQFISSANIFVPEIIPPPSPPKEVTVPKFCPHNPRSSCSSGYKRLAFSGSSPI